MMDQLQLDLSIVKKEPDLDYDYGHGGGNILDNIISETEFDQFGHAVPSVVRLFQVLFNFFPFTRLGLFLQLPFSLGSYLPC